MFPTVDKEVIELVLRENGRRLQQTLDALLVMTGGQPTTGPVQGDTPRETVQNGTQLAEDELLARSLQSHLAVSQDDEEVGANDARLVREFQRIQQDQELAMQLQRQENHRRTRAIRQVDYEYESEHENESKPNEPPLADRIGTSLSSFGEEVKSGWTAFSGKVGDLFKPSPSTSEKNGTTPKPLTFSEDGSAIMSDDDEDEDEEDFTLVNKRRQKRTTESVLKINTE